MPIMFFHAAVYIERIAHGYKDYFAHLIGITIGRTFSMRDHVSEVMGVCARSLYALRTLRSHGMNNAYLQTIFSCKTHVRFPCMEWIFECSGEK